MSNSMSMKSPKFEGGYTGLGYRDLLMCWQKGMRNGNLKKLGRIQRLHYRACMIYVKRVGRIVNALLLSQLRAAMEILMESPKGRAIKAGLERSRRILTSCILKWSPNMSFWLKEESFILYLGFMEINAT